MSFPDPIKLLLALLARLTPDTPVVVRVPEDRPREFVRIWRNGGPASSRIVDRPMVTVDVWAETEERAAHLADELRHAALRILPQDPHVRRVTEITGPYDNPDPESGTPRVRFSIQITTRARRGARR